MNTTMRRLAALVTASVATLALAACTDDKPVLPTSSKAVTPAASAAPSGPPTADLTKLTVQKLTGTTPKQLPEWKPGGNMGQYSVQTLLLLAEAAKKADLKVPPLSYALYTGDSGYLIGCNGVRQFTAQDSGAVQYCAELGAKKNVILVNTSAPSWQYTDISVGLQAHGYHPFHSFVNELGRYIVAVTFGRLPSAQQEFCTPGKLYRGVVTLQPELAGPVKAFLEDNTSSPGYFTLQGYLGTCSEI